MNFCCARFPNSRAAGLIRRPKQVFDAAGRTEQSSLRLWPGLLAFAIALNLAELIMRKGKAMMESLRPKKSLSAQFQMRHGFQVECLWKQIHQRNCWMLYPPASKPCRSRARVAGSHETMVSRGARIAYQFPNGVFA